MTRYSRAPVYIEIGSVARRRRPGGGATWRTAGGMHHHAVYQLVYSMRHRANPMVAPHRQQSRHRSGRLQSLPGGSCIHSTSVGGSRSRRKVASHKVGSQRHRQFNASRTGHDTTFDRGRENVTVERRHHARTKSRKNERRHEETRVQRDVGPYRTALISINREK